MAALLSLTWLRLATSSSARFGGRQPYLFVRKIPYVILSSGRPFVEIAPANRRNQVLG